jgi:DNA (cytosine-5)-methyltransferase 1
MRYVSIFSGVEAATLAWEPLRWEPMAFSEIEPFPCAVLAERWPDVPNLGDITKVDWKKVDWKNEIHGAVDLVVGGSPCQSFSVAGKREGLKGASGLMFEYIRCVQELRPRWFLWENVPGALTSENGEAFGQLLREMDELGYCLAWRVLDAQFFGVAQRRRRLFLVGHLGAESPAEVLFEPDCLSGNPQSSCEKRKELANRAGRSAACAGFKYNAAPRANTIGYAAEQANTLTADWHAPAVLSLPNTALSQYGTEVCTSDYASTPPLRRLTPLECERLQGFPDNHTRISWKGKPAEECPDGPRYKAIGNSMAVPVMRWLGERIEEVDGL